MQLLLRFHGFICILWFFVSPAMASHEIIGQPEPGAGQAGNDSLQIETFLEMGDRFEHTDFEAALHFYNEALQLSSTALEKAKNSAQKEVLENLRIKSLRYIAFHHKSWGKYDDALQMYGNLQTIYERSERHDFVVRALISQSNIYYYQGLYPDAIRVLQKAIPLAEAHEFTRLQADMNLNLANFLYLTGDYTRSLEHFHQSLETYNNLGLEVQHGSIFTGLGNLFSSMGNTEQALEHYQKAMQYFDELSHHNQLSNVHLSMGSLFYRKADLEQAREHYYAALHHANAMNNSRMSSQSLTNLGMLYARLQQYDTAFGYYNEAMEHASASNQQHSLCFILRNMALAHTRQGNHRQALEKANESLKIAKAIESVSDQAESLRIISQVYENQGRFGLALEHYKQYKFYNDSLLDVDKQKQLTEMDAVFRHAQQQQQIELQQMELERNKAQLQQKSQLVNMFILIVVLTLILTAVFIYYNNHKRKSNKIIIRQNQTIEENRKSIQSLLGETDILQEKIKGLEKKGLLFEKAIKGWETLGQNMLGILLPSENYIREIFQQNAYMIPEPHSGKDGVFYYVYNGTNTQLVVLAATAEKGLPAKLLGLFLAGILEKTLPGKDVKKTEDIFLLLEDTIMQLASSTHAGKINLPDYRMALLAIHKKDNRISYTSKQIPLYMAIARNTSAPGEKTDYQEIQTFGYSKGAGRVNGNHEHRNIISGNFKLKKQDRLYILLDDITGNTKNEQDAEQYHEKILFYLDNHQEPRAELQHEMLKSKIKEWCKEKNTDTCPAIWAIEL